MQLGILHQLWSWCRFLCQFYHLRIFLEITFCTIVQMTKLLNKDPPYIGSSSCFSNVFSHLSPAHYFWLFHWLIDPPLKGLILLIFVVLLINNTTNTTNSCGKTFECFRDNRWYSPLFIFKKNILQHYHLPFYGR